MFNFFGRILAAALILGTSPTLLAAPITLSGDHFSVTYDDASTGFYGVGAVALPNTVFFTPTGFDASTGVAGGSDIAAASLALRLTLDAGYALTGVTLTERGDYLLLGSGTVAVDADLSISEVAQPGNALSLALSPAGSLNLIGSPTHNWMLSGALTTTSLGAASSFDIVLDNTLRAANTARGLSFIEKKFTGLQFQVARTGNPATVPEPGALMLILAGWLAWMGLARKRRLVLSQSGK